ncbi:MAG: FkbM family methyltransferase [Bacteroidia bacterium]|nr:FkbM family methyltransferase [Bacteroidia bacterium]
MKKGIQAFLQALLGFENYLVVFSLFKIYTLRWDSQNKEGDFNYFLKFLKPEDHVLDIGANIGIMAALMAKKCKDGRVLAFEPIPENCRALLRVKKFLALKNIELYPIALGEDEGEIKMEMPIMKGVRMQGLSHVNHSSIKGYQENGVTFTVRQKCLDKMEELQDLNISAIKMDVENYEQFVLKGGLELFRKHKPVLYCELWDNENRQECFRLLGDLDYEFFVLSELGLKVFEAGKDLQHNFFFIPAERKKEFL